MGPEKARPFKEVDIAAAIESDKTTQGIGELLRPRQEAVGLFAAALREGSKTCPPLAPLLPPNTPPVNELRKRKKLANVGMTWKPAI